MGTLRELEDKMTRDVLSLDHFKHMATVMVERMVSSVKGEFNTEAKTVKTEIDKMLKSSEKSSEKASVSVNNTAAVPAQRNKRGSNKENDESKEPVNTKKEPQKPAKPARGKRGQAKKVAVEAPTPEVKPPEVKSPEVKPVAEKAKRGAKAAGADTEKPVKPPPAKRAKKADQVAKSKPVVLKQDAKQEPKPEVKEEAKPETKEEAKSEVKSEA